MLEAKINHDHPASLGQLFRGDVKATALEFADRNRWLDSLLYLKHGIDWCQARQPQGLTSDQGSVFAKPQPSVITHFRKTDSPPEGTVFGQDSSKRESKQQVSTLSRKSFPSERTVFEQPTSKEGSFPAFKALFWKYGSALPTAIRRLQGGYYHKGSITEHAFRTAYKRFCK